MQEVEQQRVCSWQAEIAQLSGGVVERRASNRRAEKDGECWMMDDGPRHKRERVRRQLD